MGELIVQPPRLRVIPDVHLFLFQGPNVLLMRRSGTGYEDGKYGVPSGHPDGGETLVAAMIRETREEVGVVVSREDVRLEHVISRKADPERISLFWSVWHWMGTPRIMEPNKCDQLRWMTREEASCSSELVPYVAFALDRIGVGELYSDFGWES